MVIDPYLLRLCPLIVLNAIWRLAATLGARSSFKKLPKRDVMGADIIQLCGLITEPAEPLALRLSSNLMVGVARYVFVCECYGSGRQAYPAVCIKARICYIRPSHRVS